MTINQVLDMLDSQQPNASTREEKLSWLTRLNGLLRDTLWVHYENAPEVAPYTPETDPDTVLPVPAPWDELYLRYLQAQIDQVNGELTRYANSSTLYNSLLSAYRDHYNRTGRVRSAGWKYF